MTNLRNVADEIADALGEKQYGPRKLVRAIVERCGARFSQQVLKDTEEVMAAGGMLTQEGDRLRTKGGVFFYLARGRMADETRNAIFPPRSGRGRQPTTETSNLPELVWDERAALFHPLKDEPGKVETVKITLIGRPGKIDMRQDLIVTTLTHSGGGTPSLPRGVPPLPERETLYTVYIGARQWRKVEDALNSDPDDPVIIDGICAYDPDLQTISVHATHVSTRALETARKQAESGTDSAPVKGKTTSAVPSAKLNELRAAADLYRQKIATLQAKPADERFGLEMTQKLLKNVEDEIAALEKGRASTTR